MTAARAISKADILAVRDTCLCFAAQKAARNLARRFDRAFALIGITNGQFSMMTAMSGMGQPKLGELGLFLAMDHATMTAAIRTLGQRGLVKVTEDAKDRRVRRVALTKAGSHTVAKAMAIWRAEHARLTDMLPSGTGSMLHAQLAHLDAGHPA